MLQRPVAYSPPRGEKLRCLSSDRFKRHYTITLPSHSALSMVKLKASQSNCKINSPSCSPSHVQKRCDKAWRNISNLLNPWRWFTSSGRTRPSSSSSPNVLSTCKPSAVLFFAVTCAKSYSLLFNPAEVGGEFHVYTLNAGSESWIRVRWIMRSYSKLLRIKNLTLSKSWDPKRKTCYYLLFIYIHLQYLFVLFKSFLYFPLRIRPVGRLKTLR